MIRAGSRSGGRWSTPGIQISRAAGDPPGDLLVAGDQHRPVHVAQHQHGRQAQVVQPVERGRLVRALELLRVGLGPDRRAQLLEHLGSGAGRRPHALVGRDDAVHVAGRAQGLELRDQLGRLVGPGVAGDAGAQQGQRLDPVRLGQGQVDGRFAAHAAPDQVHAVHPEVAQHLAQVAQPGVVPGRGGGAAEGAHVIPDDPAGLRQRGPDRIPDPRVADSRVREHDHGAVAPRVLGPHLVRAYRHHGLHARHPRTASAARSRQ